MNKRPIDDQRRRELAKIHLGAKQLGMDRETYEACLWTLARVRSARDLDAGGRAAVLDHLRACGFRPAPATTPRPGRPHNIGSEDRGAQLRKIEALLAQAKRPWAYADAMAKRMFGVDAVSWCNPTQLHKLIAALSYDARRHGRHAQS